MQLGPPLLALSLILAGPTGLISKGDHPAVAKGSCSLVTRQEAAAAFGAAVPVGAEKLADVPLKGGGSIKAQYCFYGSEVVLARFVLGPSAKSLFNDYRKSLASEDDYQIQTGIGDEAFRAKGQLAIRKGQEGLIVDVGQHRGGGAAELRKERSLALLAVARM